MNSTGIGTEYVAGLRYQAWAPYSALHPTIPPQTPLTFDVVDTWNGRTIGGRVYPMAHPAGPNYDSFPVNAYEAEARRVSRFWDQGHTPGVLESLPRQNETTHRSFIPTPGRKGVTIPPEVFNPDYP